MPKYDIALTLIETIGPKTASILLEVFKSSEEVLTATYPQLLEAKIPERLAQRIVQDRSSALLRAEFIIKHCREVGVEILVKGDERYSGLLAQCIDAPNVLYVRGNCDFNSGEWLSVVGTRKTTFAGVAACENLVDDFSKYYPKGVVVSGLAFGIDKTAHLKAMDCGIKTVAVMAGWVDDIVPRTHIYIARRIIQSGGSIVSDMPIGTQIVAANFISRNRIVAGLSSATVVVESAKRGGSLITADIANSYNRDVFAIPGRSDDESFQGTNALIKCNKAIMYQDISDITHTLGWTPIARDSTNEATQYLHPRLLEVLEALPDTVPITLEEVVESISRPLPEVSSALIQLEIKGLIKSLQGRLYQKTKN